MVVQERITPNFMYTLQKFPETLEVKDFWPLRLHSSLHVIDYEKTREVDLPSTLKEGEESEVRNKLWKSPRESVPNNRYRLSLDKFDRVVSLSKKHFDFIS